MERLRHGALGVGTTQLAVGGSSSGSPGRQWRCAAPRTYIWWRMPPLPPARSRGPREPRGLRRADPADAEALAGGEGAAPQTILFYRVGDFYEMFYEDAELAARVLDITLTSRGDGVPLAGVPVKAAAEYLRQLVGAGHRVAICEQVEDPKLAKGLVRREVVETVTPGALLQEGWLAGGRNNFLVALCAVDERDRASRPSISAPASSCWRPWTGGGAAEALARLAPAEVVVPGGSARSPAERASCARVRERWEFDPDLAREELARRFALASLDGLGIGPEDAPALGAAGALLRYLDGAAAGRAAHLARPTVRRNDAFLWLDEMTRRNLELVEPLRAGARGCTLLETIDAHRDADGRPPAPAVAALAAAGSGGHRLPARRGRRRGAGRPRAGPAPRGAGRRAGRGATGRSRRGGPRHPARAGRPARLVPPAPRCRRGAQRARRLDAPGGGRAAALADALDELDLLADLAAELAARARGAAASHARRRRRDPPGLRRRARRAASAARRRPAVHRLAPAARARAHRDLLAQGRLQQGVRLLPRDHQRARGQSPLRLRAAADAGGGRAVRDARAQGLRGSRARRRGADGGARGGAVRRPPGGRGPGDRAGPADGPGARAARRVGGARRPRGERALRAARRCTTDTTWCSARAAIR